MAHRWIDRANVRLVSDGSLPGTHVYFVDGDKETEVFPVTSVYFSFDIEHRGAEAVMTIVLAPCDITVPAELVEFVREPVYTIRDDTPWYTKLYLALKRTVKH